MVISLPFGSGLFPVHKSVMEARVHSCHFQHTLHLHAEVERLAWLLSSEKGQCAVDAWTYTRYAQCLPSVVLTGCIEFLEERGLIAQVTASPPQVCDVRVHGSVRAAFVIELVAG